MSKNTHTEIFFGKNKEDAYQRVAEDSPYTFTGLTADIVSISRLPNKWPISVEWSEKPVHKYKVVFKRAEQPLAVTNYATNYKKEAFKWAREDASRIWPGVKAEIVSIMKTSEKAKMP